MNLLYSVFDVGSRSLAGNRSLAQARAWSFLLLLKLSIIWQIQQARWRTFKLL
jgi:hypothetical protein